MATIGFLGLGIMGGPMAANLQRAGHEVLGWNRSPGKAGALLEAGGHEAGSIAEAVVGADVVAVMVTDGAAVTEVLTGDDGVLARGRRGALVIVFSSIEPHVTLDLAQRAQTAGMRLVDAPVSGGDAGAVEATLSVMVGGAPDDVADVRPVLDAVGSTVEHVGPVGAGQTVKAANQLMVAGNLALLAEALVFLEAAGVDTRAAVTVLGAGLAGSAVLDRKALTMLDRSFEPGARIDIHHKDLGIFADAARGLGVVTPVGAVVAQLMAAARAQGDGALDHSGIFRAVERLSGRSDD